MFVRMPVRLIQLLNAEERSTLTVTISAEFGG